MSHTYWKSGTVKTVHRSSSAYTRMVDGTSHVWHSM